MRNYLVPAFIAAAMVLGGAANAAEASGTVNSWVATTHTLTLEDGHVYVLPASFTSATAFTAGEKVKITYDVKNGENMATAAVMAG